MRLRGLEKRMANKMEREANAEIQRDYQLALQAMHAAGMDELPAVDILRVLMAVAMMHDDQKRITELAILIAPYETPKIKSQEVKVVNNLSDKTDEELAQMARDLGLFD